MADTGSPSQSPKDHHLESLRFIEEEAFIHGKKHGQEHLGHAWVGDELADAHWHDFLKPLYISTGIPKDSCNILALEKGFISKFILGYDIGIDRY